VLKLIPAHNYLLKRVSVVKNGSISKTALQRSENDPADGFLRITLKPNQLATIRVEVVVP
ncbi:MAG: hypothetical protein M1330_03605, partial [Armatimonadetes bacterium]|nr:hypothetical protein [Armatimonadota bacterium]